MIRANWADEPMSRPMGTFASHEVRRATRKSRGNSKAVSCCIGKVKNEIKITKEAQGEKQNIKRREK